MKASSVWRSDEGCAKCRCRNPHEARETYKTLRDQNIGGAADAAELYCQWASLELSAGETCLSTAKQFCCLASKHVMVFTQHLLRDTLAKRRPLACCR